MFYLNTNLIIKLINYSIKNTPTKFKSLSYGRTFHMIGTAEENAYTNKVLLSNIIASDVRICFSMQRRFN